MEKKLYKTSIKTFLCQYLRASRAQRKISQEKMAEMLHVSLRAYSAIENGVYGVSVFSFIFFLLNLPDEEVLHLLHELRDVIKLASQDAA